MKKLFVCSLLAGAFVFAAPALIATASAAPASPAGVELPAPGIEQAATRRRGMKSRQSRRGMISSREARQRSSINAKNPALSPSQQNQGSTTGGPRY